MADKSNGIIYGVAEVKFKEKVIGYIDEQGMQPAGNAPSFMDVHAAQVQDGPVDSIMTNPGSDAFTFNLIQLKAENLVDVIGGTKGGMEAVLDEVLGKNPNARICISAIALETLGAAIAALTARGLTAEVTQIAVSRTKTAGSLHLLMANNPVFLITGART